MAELEVWMHHLEHFVSVRKLTDDSRELYRFRVGLFLGWCRQVGVSPDHVTERDMPGYLKFLRDIPHKPSTINSEFRVLQLFYKWLLAEGLVQVNPAAAFDAPDPEPRARDTLTVEQMKRMWLASDAERDRAVVGLMGICAVRTSELVRAQVQDLSTVNGRHVLRIPGRKGVFEVPFAAIPDEIYEPVRELVGDRRHGALIRRVDGEPLDRRTLYRWVHRIGRLAGIPFPVTNLTLSFSLRALAIEHGFSYVSVIRTVAEIEPRRLAKWVSRAPDTISSHAAFRIIRLVLGGGDTDALGHLMNAEVMVTESDSHPAAALAFAGAALEQHLRLLTAERLLTVNKAEPTLSSYAAVLRGKKVISASDVQRIARIQSHRNDAAHGWFERVSATDAMTVIDEVRELIAKYKLSAVNQE